MSSGTFGRVTLSPGAGHRPRKAWEFAERSFEALGLDRRRRRPEAPERLRELGDERRGAAHERAPAREARRRVAAQERLAEAPALAPPARFGAREHVDDEQVRQPALQPPE